MPKTMKTLQQEKLIKAQEEQQRKAKEDAANKAKAEAERKAREDAANKAKAEAARKAREDAANKAREEEARKAREEQQRKEEAKFKNKAAKEDWVKKKAGEFNEARKSKAEDEKSSILSSTNQEKVKKSTDNIFDAKNFFKTAAPILKEYEELLNSRNKCGTGFTESEKYEYERSFDWSTGGFVTAPREEDGEKVETLKYKKHKAEANKCESNYSKSIAKKLIEYRTEISKQKDDLIKAFNQIEKVQVLKNTKDNFIEMQCKSLHNTANEANLKFNELLKEYCSYNECSQNFIQDFVICDRDAFVSDGFPL